MHSYPTPALIQVKTLTQVAESSPSRAMAFQGAPGCNSHRAALDFDPECAPLPCFSFEDALDAVKEGRADRAIIPIENSQHGRVADMHFLLPESGLSIVGEHFIGIHPSLMALPGAKGPFTAAYSHPQALGQSRHYLRERGITPMSYADTAGAAAYVKEMNDPEAAAIAPPWRLNSMASTSSRTMSRTRPTTPRALWCWPAPRSIRPASRGRWR
jgi:prephenate dehydratase